MMRSLLLLVFAVAASTAHAASFQLTPQIIAVAPGQHTQELTLSLLPGINTVGAEIEIVMNLDRFGWVQAMPSSSTPGVTKACTVVNGVVRAVAIAATQFDSMYSIPVCRIRIRPHASTPLGNYYTSYANGYSMRIDGSLWSASGNSVRVIVDD